VSGGVVGGWVVGAGVVVVVGGVVVVVVEVVVLVVAVVDVVVVEVDLGADVDEPARTVTSSSFISAHPATTMITRITSPPSVLRIPGL